MITGEPINTMINRNIGEDYSSPSDYEDNKESNGFHRKGY